jgi:hypothetical protein
LSYQSITPKIYANSAWGYVIEECSNVRRKPLTDGRPVDLWREELEEVAAARRALLRAATSREATYRCEAESFAAMPAA